MRRSRRFRVALRPAWLLAATGWLTAAAWATSAPPDPERAFEDRDMAPVRAWLAALPEAGREAPDALRARAWLARRAGESDTALELIDRAIERAPERADYRVDRAAFRSDQLDGSRSLAALRVARDVRRDLEQAVAFEPKHVDALVGLIAFHRQAPGIAGGRDRRADELMERLAGISPAHHALRVAMRSADEERYGDAVDAIAHALADAEYAPLKWRLREARWLSASGRHAAARQRLLALLARSPDFGPALYELGSVALASGTDGELGRDALRRYLALPAWPVDPDPARAWLNLGRLHAAGGDARRAEAAFRRSLALDPDKATARRARRALESSIGAQSTAD